MGKTKTEENLVNNKNEETQPKGTFNEPQKVLVGLYIPGKHIYLQVHEHELPIPKNSQKPAQKVLELVLSMTNVASNGGTQKDTLSRNIKFKTGIEFSVSNKLGSLTHSDSRSVVQAEVYELKCRSISADEVDSKFTKFTLKEVLQKIKANPDAKYSVSHNGEKFELPISLLTQKILLEYEKRFL